MKHYLLGIILIVIAILGFSLFEANFFKNDIQNIQIRQSITGKVDVNRSCGYYTMFFPTIWT